MAKQPEFGRPPSETTKTFRKKVLSMLKRKAVPVPNVDIAKATGITPLKSASLLRAMSSIGMIRLIPGEKNRILAALPEAVTRED